MFSRIINVSNARSPHQVQLSYLAFCPCSIPPTTAGMMLLVQIKKEKAQHENSVSIVLFDRSQHAPSVGTRGFAAVAVVAVANWQFSAASLFR